MAAPYHKAKRKSEDAIEALINRNRGDLLVYVDEAGATQELPIFKGLSGADLTVPRIQIVAEKAAPEVFGEGDIGGVATGNMFVTVHIAVIGNAHDLTSTSNDKDTFVVWCGVVEDALMNRDVADKLNQSGVQDFRAYTWRPEESEDAIDEDRVVCTYSGVLYMAPSGGG
jgi:hypothetical protein